MSSLQERFPTSTLLTLRKSQCMIVVRLFVNASGISATLGCAIVALRGLWFSQLFYDGNQLD